MIRKVKNWLGIEGVKVELMLPETFDEDQGVVKGRYLISTQSTQTVKGVHLTMVEKYRRGRRKSKLIDEYTIGQKFIEFRKTIHPDNILSQEFSLPFERAKSGMEKFGDRNILYRGVAKLAKLAKNAKSTYFLTIEVDVEGNKLKPYDTVELVAD